MLIDIHAHMITPGMLKRHSYWGPFTTADGFTVGDFALKTKNFTAITDDEAERRLLAAMSHDGRREIMSERGVDKLVLSIPSHAFMYWADDFGSEYAAICNDELAAYCAADPQHFNFWAHANLAQPTAAAREIERAVSQLGAVGVSAGGTNFAGLEAHNEELFPVWEVLCKHDAPLMVHAYDQNVWHHATARAGKFATTSILGDLYDETLFF